MGKDKTQLKLPPHQVAKLKVHLDFTDLPPYEVAKLKVYLDTHFDNLLKTQPLPVKTTMLDIIKHQ